MSYQAVIKCSQDINNLHQALKPEEHQDKRASLKIKKIKNQLEIKITAQDATSLRAMIASITRLLTIYEKK